MICLHRRIRNFRVIPSVSYDYLSVLIIHVLCLVCTCVQLKFSPPEVKADGRAASRRPRTPDLTKKRAGGWFFPRRRFRSHRASDAWRESEARVEANCSATKRRRRPQVFFLASRWFPLSLSRGFSALAPDGTKCLLFTRAEWAPPEVLNFKRV